MIRTISIPPDAQLEPALRGYADANRAKQRKTLLFIAVTALCTALAVQGAEIDPLKFWSKIGNFSSYVGRLAHLDTGALGVTDFAEWYWGLRRWLRLLGETLMIAYVGTITGFVGGFIGCFLCSRNLTGSVWLRSIVRRLLEFCRTVPDIVFALIFVSSFGLGAIPGVRAIAIHTTGALGKLFSEVVENINMKPVEGLIASGATWFERIRFAVVAQVLSNFASYALLRLEVNVRGAAVIGIVGAGGIGQEFITAVRRFFYSDVSAILLLMVACVMIIDFISERIRYRLLAMDGGR